VAAVAVAVAVAMMQAVKSLCLTLGRGCSLCDIAVVLRYASNSRLLLIRSFTRLQLPYGSAVGVRTHW
jgi:hypothetical protein